MSDEKKTLTVLVASSEERAEARAQRVRDTLIAMDISLLNSFKKKVEHVMETAANVQVSQRAPEDPYPIAVVRSRLQMLRATVDTAIAASEHLDGVRTALIATSEEG